MGNARARVSLRSKILLAFVGKVGGRESQCTAETTLGYCNSGVSRSGLAALRNN